MNSSSLEPGNNSLLWHSLSLDEVFNRLKSQRNGLAENIAQSRLKQLGYNEIKSTLQISPIKIFLRQLHSFVIYVLLVALLISFFLGEGIDALVIGVIIALNAFFGFIQEYKAEKSIEALKKLASPHALVLRNGKQRSIDTKELVPGDVILLQTGDKVPADSRLIDFSDFETSEASLTGESFPIKKKLSTLPEKTALADRVNMVFSGTIVSKGKGTAIVTQTGFQTELGRVASLIQEASEEETPLQRKLDRLGKKIGIITLVVCLIVFISQVLKEGSFSQHVILEFFIVAVSLAVAAIPEGLPAVVTIGLAIGVQRMVKRNALIRRLPSVETLGSTTVICTDKTGTLTQNEMTVKKIYANGKVFEVTGSGYKPQGDFIHEGIQSSTDPLHWLLKIGALNNDAFIENEQPLGDPTEASLLVCAEKAGFNIPNIRDKFPRKNEIAFTSERKIMTTIHSMDGADHALVKGAPEVVLNICQYIYEDEQIVALTPDKRKEILNANQSFAEDAHRVLGFAFKKIQDSSKIEEDLVFAGLQAMIDPPRIEVKQSIERCHDAGIRVIMITGDHHVTASAIAKKIGIEGRTVTGSEFEEIRELEKEVESIAIFARVNPEHKFKIVQALQNKGHIVAMTGDGVNDGPALKEADIGIAMGITGTDVAKEASDMVLTDDNFSSIVNAVEEGRNIYDNIRKFVAYLLSSNLGEILTLFTAILIGLPLPLVAIMILWLNLITDGLPALSLSVEPGDPNNMQNPPEDPQKSILSSALISLMVVVSFVMMAGTLLVFSWYLNDHDLNYAQSVAFSIMTLGQMFNVLNCRSAHKSVFEIGFFSNPKLLMAIGISILLHFLVIYSPLNVYFQTVPIKLMDWGWILLASLPVWIIIELYKKIFSRFIKLSSPQITAN